MAILEDTYSADFFDETAPASALAGRVFLSYVRERVPMRSVLDVGCGVGLWLDAAKSLGATEVAGIDGPHVPSKSLRIKESEFTQADLEEYLPDLGRFDLAICMEVAEHLSAKRALSFIGDITRASDVVLFSAAIPYQGGDGHLNEMWPEYWAGLFAEKGYAVWDGIRAEVWDRNDIPFWYRQNALLFVNRNRWRKYLGDAAESDADNLTRIHPECYLWASRRARAKFATSSFELDVDAFHNAHRPDCHPPGYGPEFGAPTIYGRKRRR